MAEKIKLKPCPLCGFMPKVFGREVREYVDGVWAEKTRKEYWIQPFCFVSCPVENHHANKYGVVGGLTFKTEESAIKYWNKGCVYQ